VGDGRRQGYVLGLSVWVLGAGCYHMPGDSATGQFAGASGAGLFAAGRGGSGGPRTIHFAEVARSPDREPPARSSRGRSRNAANRAADAASCEAPQGVLGVTARDGLAAGLRSRRLGSFSAPSMVLFQTPAETAPIRHRPQRRCRCRQHRQVVNDLIR
jgi:hypothetical protein